MLATVDSYNIKINAILEYIIQLIHTISKQSQKFFKLWKRAFVNNKESPITKCFQQDIDLYQAISRFSAETSELCKNLSKPVARVLSLLNQVKYSNAVNFEFTFKIYRELGSLASTIAIFIEKGGRVKSTTYMCQRNLNQDLQYLSLYDNYKRMLKLTVFVYVISHIGLYSKLNGCLILVEGGSLLVTVAFMNVYCLNLKYIVTNSKEFMEGTLTDMKHELDGLTKKSQELKCFFNDIAITSVSKDALIRSIDLDAFVRKSQKDITPVNDMIKRTRKLQDSLHRMQKESIYNYEATEEFVDNGFKNRWMVFYIQSKTLDRFFSFFI
ncbi:uncharacterized protein EV154DRAFT_478934 [Mucor mucedo]|uniref:uncharacterized protein n=1 Tax=Mucor mucedo TaxID=29922 RepID=UPI00222077D7|nr:uncharacterized protein EV154DRAFT_478934 [Mucor mucedo]KAI7893881.1 hypothetical protein EV154DRAFT_478934 [Mucor mucedo]